MDEQNLDDKVEQAQEEQNLEEDYHRDRFTDFMFGQRSGPQQRIEQNRDVNPNHNSIDYEQLMFHIDSFMESTKDLKPLFQKFQPFLEQFWKKK